MSHTSDFVSVTNRQQEHSREKQRNSKDENNRALLQSSEDSVSDFFIWSFQMCSKQRSKHVFFLEKDRSRCDVKICWECCSFYKLNILILIHVWLWGTTQ